MLGGFLACLLWELFAQERIFPRFGIDAVEVGVVTSLILFVVVSRLTIWKGRFDGKNQKGPKRKAGFETRLNQQTPLGFATR